MFNFLQFSWSNRKEEKFSFIEQIPSPEFIDILNEFAKLKKENKEKLVLVLPGGGSRGRWQFGVIYWLYQIGVLNYIDLICGTSVGGLNALLTAKNINNMKNALDVWLSIKNNSNIYDGMFKFTNLFDFAGMTSQIIKDNKGKCIIYPKGLYRLIDNYFCDMCLKDLSCKVSITTTTLCNGEMQEINSDVNPNFKVALLAKLTSAIPVIFPSIEFESDLGVDGGLGRNNPVALAIKHGATKIILIGTTSDKIQIKKINNNIIDVASRLESVIMHIFEEYAWDEVEQYKRLSILDPNRYPTIEFLDIYPKNNEECENDVLNFTKVETLQNGYNNAIKNITPQILKNFLLT